MSLTTPILNNVPAWDKNNGQVFTFNVIGGDIVQGNRLVIIQDNNDQEVYREQQTTYQYKHIVPNNTALENGVLYRAYVQTYNGSNWSAQSNTILFYCFTTPEFSLSIQDIIGGVIKTSYVIPILQYQQLEGEAISDYRFLLYDTANNLISQSDVVYTGLSNITDINNLVFTYGAQYIFQGLENLTGYSVQVIGHTTGGTYIETTSVDFNVQYEDPEEYNVLYLQNNCNDGYINYRSMAYIIGGSSYPSSPIYTDDGINLLSTDSYVEWDAGFVVPDNFTVKAWLEQPKINSVLFTMYKDNTNYIQVSYIEDPVDNTKGIITLDVIMNNNKTYFIYSNSFSNNANSICIQIRNIDDIYEVIVEVLD